MRLLNLGSIMDMGAQIITLVFMVRYFVFIIIVL